MPFYTALELIVYLVAVADLALFAVAASIFTLARCGHAQKRIKGKAPKA